MSVSRSARSVRSTLLGAVGGVVATATMTAVMAVAERAGFVGRPPPAILTTRILHWLGARPPRPIERALTVVAHVGFGAGAGALFGALAGALDRDDTPPLVSSPLAKTLAGPLYGLAVWALSYAGWVPATGLMPAPRDDRPMRPVSMIAAHLVYGGTLAATHRALTRTSVSRLREALDRPLESST